MFQDHFGVDCPICPINNRLRQSVGSFAPFESALIATRAPFREAPSAPQPLEHIHATALRCKYLLLYFLTHSAT